jgi:hippurate hydrolase
MVTRRFDAFDPVVLTVGKLQAGSVANVISPSASFEATVRSFSPQSRALVAEETLRVVRGIGAAHGLTVDAEFEYGYPVTVNDATEATFAAQTVNTVLGDGRYVEMPHAIAGSEDFGVIGALVPSAYVMLGACPPDRDPFTAAYNHAPEAAFDDAVLGDAAALLAGLALGRLERG